MMTDTNDIIVSIVGAVIAGITAIFFAIQLQRQKTVDSARFTIDYLDDILEKNSEVVDILYKRETNNSVQFKSDKSVRVFLNGLEDVIQFVNDGIIEDKHVITTLGLSLLKVLKDDSEVKRIIKEQQDKNRTTYELISGFLAKNVS